MVHADIFYGKYIEIIEFSLHYFLLPVQEMEMRLSPVPGEARGSSWLGVFSADTLAMETHIKVRETTDRAREGWGGGAEETG